MRTNVGENLRDQRGVVLPMALLVLVILMALTLAFSTLATTEGVVGRNHSLSTQARGYAESAVERAIWALGNPTDANGIPDPMSGATAAAPYNGINFFTVSSNGGFTLRVDGGAVTNERLITAIGWAPDSTGTLRAAKKIQVTIMRHRWTSVIPPCALCVMGTLEVGGNANIDARSNACSGGTPQGGTMTLGPTLPPIGAATIYGPGNEIANEDADTPQNAPSSDFGFKMTAEEFNILRDQARANNAYYQGTVTFDSSNLPPSGIVFVDTTTGQDIVGGATPTPLAERANVTITGNVTWSGWLIVAGALTISGTVDLSGTVYTQNDFTFTGNGTLRGSVISENRIDTVATVIDSSVTGSSNIIYDCSASQTGGGSVSAALRDSWFVKSGTFRETEGR